VSEPFLAEIKMVSFNFPPKGWAFCNGQLLSINQNQALFALLGTTYGGNGQTTFALPNLQGCAPLHAGADIVIGQVGGEQAHTLNAAELPTHSHVQQASSQVADNASPVSHIAAGETTSAYSNLTADSAMLAPTSSIGGSQPHDNMQPYLVLNFVIALAGIFPSRN
jgi:microcystin-dependent protein